jgi:hypothetical protein
MKAASSKIISELWVNVSPEAMTLIEEPFEKRNRLPSGETSIAEPLNSKGNLFQEYLIFSKKEFAVAELLETSTMD